LKPRLRLKLLLALIATALLAYSPLVARAKPLEVVAVPVDWGYMRHVEYVPRPRYTHKSMTVAEVSRELLIKAVYREQLDSNLLDFVLASYRNGYFAVDPSSSEPDVESTFYAFWLLRTIGADKKMDSELLARFLCDEERFTEAFYAYRLLKMLGYNVSLECLKGWDLGYAVSYLRGSNAPDVESTKLWLLLSWDEEKAKWLEEEGVEVPRPGEPITRVEDGDWFLIELLIIRRPVYINATIYPRVVVSGAPALLKAEAVRWPIEALPVNYSLTVENGSLKSVVSAGGRKLEFTHLVARREYAVISISRGFGSITVSCSYKPPYRLTMKLAGEEYSWVSNDYDFNATVEPRAYGSLRAWFYVEREGVLMVAEAEIRLEPPAERSLIDAAFVALPAASMAPGLAASRGRRKKMVMLAIIASPIPLICSFRIEEYPLWATLAYGAFSMTACRLLDGDAFYRALGHVAVVLSLAAASIFLVNPLILLLGGFGAAIFLASAILYPSEFSKTERFYKSTMLLYSLGVLAMSLVCEAAADIASLMWMPESGFVNSVRAQSMLAANLFSLTPVIAPIYHLARLVLSYEKAKEASELLKNMIGYGFRS